MGTSDFRSAPRLLALVAPTTVIGTVRPRRLMGTSDFRSAPRLLALVAPTAVIGTVRPRRRRKCNYVLNRTIGLAQVKQINCCVLYN
jgi:hypothetical protein